MFRNSKLKVHFIGIGGMGMCGIAEVLINLGYRVSGSDIQENAITKHLASIGATVFYGHKAENLEEADVVVVSTAIKGYNPEIEGAQARRIPVIPRAEMLGELMRMKTGITVAGSHGKTTTTTMIAHVLTKAGLDPTAVIGGRVNSFGLANARFGTSEYLVAEADESDGSFLGLHPTLAVVTNIDAEHLDHYGTFENVKIAFADFINRVPFYGRAALCIDDPALASILPLVKKRYVTYGTAAQADFRARNIRFEGAGCSFIAWHHARELGEIKIPLPGTHNVLNALAVIAMCDSLKIPFETVVDALGSFEGIQRRFSLRAEIGGVTYAFTSDPPDLSSAVDESSLYPTAALDVQIIPPKLRADQVPDSLDIIYRAVLAEELLLVVKALLEPLSNSTENEAQPLREHLRGLFGYCRTVMPPSDRDTATDIDVSHTDRRGKWNRELLAIVKGGLPESTGNEALRDLCALVCAEMGVVEPLSADGFRFRGEGSKPGD